MSRIVIRGTADTEAVTRLVADGDAAITLLRLSASPDSHYQNLYLFNVFGVPCVTFSAESYQTAFDIMAAYVIVMQDCDPAKHRYHEDRKALKHSDALENTRVQYDLKDGLEAILRFNYTQGNA